MKYLDEYRDRHIVKNIASEIDRISRSEVSLMEVCGGHTMAIHRYGLPSLLPENIRLLSGPGCPVCVTGRKFIDAALFLAAKPGVIITTYGDLIRVPGSTGSLDKAKAGGADIRMVYSTLDALNIARQNPQNKVVFLGIGFETTSPATAAALLNAESEGICNFFVYSSHKVMPPAMEALITEGVKINGYICPGHVSAITGSGIYGFIPEKYRLACVISGFEPVDIMQSILMLVKQIEQHNYQVEIQYTRAVRPGGNPIARKMMDTVFEPCDEHWRGFGIIPQSGLRLSERFSGYDAEKVFGINIPEPPEEKGCICGEILKGLKKPADCGLFRKRCTPADPVGACMVSNEGACAAHYRYSAQQ